MGIILTRRYAGKNRMPGQLINTVGATPKAFDNLARRNTPGNRHLKFLLNPERVPQHHRVHSDSVIACGLFNPFRVGNLCGDGIVIGGPNPACYAGAKLFNAFGVARISLVQTKMPRRFHRGINALYRLEIYPARSLLPTR